MTVDDLKFDANGLIPAVVQDYYTKKVLTVAYMNRESLAISMKEGRTCFYSRSRQCLWRKGETSGNVQEIVCIRADCDADALVVEVIKAGPACHTGEDSCFFNEIYQSEDHPSVVAEPGILHRRRGSSALSRNLCLFPAGRFGNRNHGEGRTVHAIRGGTRSYL